VAPHFRKDALGFHPLLEPPQGLDHAPIPDSYKQRSTCDLLFKGSPSPYTEREMLDRGKGEGGATRGPTCNPCRAGGYAGFHLGPEGYAARGLRGLRTFFKTRSRTLRGKAERSGSEKGSQESPPSCSNKDRCSRLQ
jgi:hypothetical protein